MAVEKKVWYFSLEKQANLTNIIYYFVCLSIRQCKKKSQLYFFNYKQYLSGRMSNIYIQEPPTNGKVSATFCNFNFHFILEQEPTIYNLTLLLVFVSLTRTFSYVARYAEHTINASNVISYTCIRLQFKLQWNYYFKPSLYILKLPLTVSDDMLEF